MGAVLQLLKWKAVATAVFAGASSGTAAKDFIVHIGPVAGGVTPAQHQRGTTGAAGDSSLRGEGSQGSEIASATVRAVGM